MENENRKDNVVKRLQDWKTCKNPFFDEYPELLRGWYPDPLKDPDLSEEEKLEMLSASITDTVSWGRENLK